ncbi:phosphate ABC transporter permease subunit PstC [Plectonema cf. radiosum LEGE 06105]|uniref:Phosphate transport system permease protein n=1 Tax=Plectonema cf. radiosum LEGE 06105 TaxID=945769 RepID=A0A8J7F2R6_9CYAN|nr:phosphate ABC transporter permease subunit PstC [Plectonema radiosum]MBE9212808.1 phosphate ABC transporter permease subunit PstC [Plectonema cf. radiosum LEGE 06105]
MANSSVQPNSAVDGKLDIFAQDAKNIWLEKGFKWLVHGFAIFVAILFLWMVYIIFQQAKPAIDKFGLGFLWSQEWNIEAEIYGALPYIYGTLASSLLAILIAVPVGLAIALVTSEDFLPSYVRSPAAFMVELIAAIPSVIIGLWGVYILIPVILPLQTWLSANFKWIPLFNTDSPSGDNLLTAGIILAIMILPIMAAISRDVLLVIPKHYRSGSMALGATRWETIFRVLLPTGLPGIVGATMLALGRALGETVAVTMVIGNSLFISASLLDGSYTIPAVLANEFPEAEIGLHTGALTYLALILFVITLAVNIGAVVLVQLLNRKKK